jgi:hypothetical protein
MSTAIIVNQDAMGHGSLQLGRRILQTAFSKASVFQDLEVIVFYNSGVQLLVQGSACLPALSALHDRGVDLIACGTCTDYFGVRDKIALGRVGGMDDILAALAEVAKIVTL